MVAGADRDFFVGARRFAGLGEGIGPGAVYLQPVLGKYRALGSKPCAGSGHLMPDSNPEAITASSPRLRGTSTLGWETGRDSTPTELRPPEPSRNYCPLRAEFI